METHTVTPNSGSDPAEPSPTTMFRAFAEPHRQYALQYLTQRPGAVPLGDLAEYIAVTDGDPTRDRYERALVGLFHQHVPHLTDAGLVRYDSDRELLSLRVDGDLLRPYLELAALEEHSG